MRCAIAFHLFRRRQRLIDGMLPAPNCSGVSHLTFKTCDFARLDVPFLEKGVSAGDRARLKPVLNEAEGACR
jgi:hypothetical protein